MLDELHLQPPASPAASRSPVWARGWVAVTVAAYALALKAGARGGPGSRLLVLRVFASKRQALQLLDGLQARWRYVGAVHQIGGPDLAVLNVDPCECARFLSGRLLRDAGQDPQRLRRQTMDSKASADALFDQLLDVAARRQS